MGIKVLALETGSNPFPLILKLRQVVGMLQPSIIHAWMYHAALFSLFAGHKAPKIMGIRHSLHDLSKDKLTTRAVIHLLAWLSNRFAAIVYNSATSKDQHQAIGYRSANDLFIPNGFDTDIFKPYDSTRKSQLRIEFSIPDSTFVFGYVARYHPVKNHLGLLKAFAEVVKHNSNVMLVLIGQGLSSNNNTVKEIINPLDLEKAVTLLGERNDIPELLQALDAYVSPSHAEAFPNTIGESMSCGIPCIATDVGDSAAIISDTGIVVPPNDNDALTKAMLRIAQMPKEEREALGKKAQQRILDNYRLERVTKQYEDLYLSLSEKHLQK